MTGRARDAGEGSIFPYRNGFAAYTWIRIPSGKRAKKWVYGKTRELVHDKWIKLQRQALDTPVPTSTRPWANTWTTGSPHRQAQPRAVDVPDLRDVCAPLHRAASRQQTSRPRDLRTVQAWINTIARACQCCVQGKDAGRPAAEQRCCALGRCCHTTISTRTLSDIRACLRASLAHAVDADLISKNVAVTVKLPKNRSRSTRRKAWTTDEARRFPESARADGDPLYPAYVLILVLGLRKGEVLGLTWTHVDVSAAELHIALQLQRVGGGLLLRETKTEGSDGTLPLPQICCTALQLRREQQAEDRATAGSAWHETGLAFSTRFGTPIEPRNFNRSWTTRCTKAGVRTITVHDGRRSCGTLLADLDVHPRVAMQILRHAQFALTMEIYTLASPEATKEALKRLGNSLDGPTPDLDEL